MSNPSKFEDAEDIAKESLKLYINAYQFSRDIQQLQQIVMIPQKL